MGPAGKARVQLLAWREVLRRAVLAAHVDVAELVAAFVAGVEEAAVVGKIRGREDGVGRRARQRLGLSARRRDGVGVPDARAVRRDQDLRAVGRERRAEVLGVLVEVGDRVLRDRRRRRRRRLPGRAAAGGTTGYDQADEKTSAHAHGHRLVSRKRHYRSGVFITTLIKLPPGGCTYGASPGASSQRGAIGGHEQRCIVDAESGRAGAAWYLCLCVCPILSVRAWQLDTPSGNLFSQPLYTPGGEGTALVVE